MRLSASGCARNGLRSIKQRKELYNATAAISALHDGLLAVVQGRMTREQAREFFCFDDESQFIGGVLEIKGEKKPDHTIELLETLKETRAYINELDSPIMRGKIDSAIKNAGGE